MTENGGGKGTAFFVRHGESTSNDRNVFAGIHDVYLTEYGKLQARRAGQDIKRRGTKFDAIFVSHMRRARQTCQLVMEECDPDCTLPHQIDHRLAEKSFGIFAGRNINVLRMVYGFKTFERLTASGHEEPPAAEPLSEVFARVSNFYDEVVKPLTDAGKNVLVVSHQYALEPLALYLGGKSPADYAGAMDLPNGKALSSEDLKKFLKHHHDGFAKKVKVARDATLVFGMNFVALAGCLAAIIKLAIAIRMPTDCFTVLLTVALSVSSFYTYLDINIAASFRSVPRADVLLCIATWLARLAICIPIAARTVNHQQFLWVLLFIVPPALTAPVTSMLWGGGKYLAVVGSVLLYLTVPPVLGVLPYQSNYIYDNKSMTLFYVVLGAGLIFPAACAQLWRKRSPVEAAKHRKEYSFLSVWALTALSFIAIYQVTPARRDASIISNMYYPFVHPVDSLECARNFWQAFTVYMGMKLTTAMVRKTLVYTFNFQAEHCMDLYILHTCPNIFLWLGLANSITSPDVTYTKFWGVFMFFMLPVVEQSFIIKSFMHRLIRQTTQSKHITIEQLDVVWTVLKSVQATCVDPDGEEVLDLQGVGAFLKYVEHLTTGVKEDVPEYMVSALFELLDEDNSGFVTKSELFTYVSSVGLVIDLNGKPRGAGSEKPKERMLSKVTNAVGLTRELTSKSKFFSKRLSQATAADLAAADRLIEEMRNREQNTSIKMLSELDQAKSKALNDLKVAAAAHEPMVIERSASRLLPLHHEHHVGGEGEHGRRNTAAIGRINSGGIQKSNSVSSIKKSDSDAAPDVELAASDVQIAPPSPPREEAAPAEPEQAAPAEPEQAEPEQAV